MPLIFYVIILFIILELLSYIYSKLFSQLFILRYSIILGIFLHEFSHYLACKITFTPVKRFHIDFKKGYVVHGRPKIPILGGFIISLAPFFLGIAGLVGIIYFVNYNNQYLINNSVNAIQTFNWGQAVGFIKEWMFSLNFRDWVVWLAIFFSLNILATFTPSKKDYKNIFIGIILYSIISYFVNYFDKINLGLIYILCIANIILIVFIFFLIILNLFKKVFRFL